MSEVSLLTALYSEDVMSRETEMDETIAKIKVPDGLGQFAANVEGRSPKHAQAARLRAVELRAAAHGATSDAEREALEAVYAYERAQSKLLGKRFHASQTWPMIQRRGIIPALEFLVTTRAETTGYRVLVEMGMQHMAFEAVVLRHPDVFSHEALTASKSRLRDWERKEQQSGDISAGRL